MNATERRNWRYVLPSAPKIGYLGWLGHGNLGDEVNFLASQRLFPTYRLLPFKSSAKTVWFERLMRQRLFVASFLGGGTLINKREMLESFQIAQRRYQPSVVFGTGVADPIFWGQTTGERDSLKEWVACLEACSFVGVRGPRSKDLLKNAGFQRAEVVGDPALFFADDRIIPKSGNKLLGVNIGTADNRLWGDERHILEFVVRLVKVMIEKGYRIVFVPAWEPDLAYIEEAAKRINHADSVTVFRPDESLDRTMECLRACDLFIGEKLHSVVLALCANTPSLMLAYRPKCLDFMLSMDLDRFCVRTDRLSLDGIVDLIEELAQHIESYQLRISQKATAFHDLQKARAAEIADRIGRTLNA